MEPFTASQKPNHPAMNSNLWHWQVPCINQIKSKTNPNRCTQTPNQRLSTRTPQCIIDGKKIHDQILKDMTTDFTKMINTEINVLHTEIAANLGILKHDLQHDLNSQITKVLKTIQILNQWFTEVMDCLPPQPTQMPAHKKPKGEGMSN